MASTSYLVRAIFKEHTDSGATTDFAGTYKLLVKAKSMPAPVSAPNTVESTTLEDDTQTYEMGIKKSDAKEISGNLEKEYLDAIDDLNGKKIDIPSYRIKPGDVISLRENSRKSTKFKEIVELTNGRVVPLWLEANKEDFSAKVVRMPVKEDLDYEVEEHLIVELYSK